MKYQFIRLDGAPWPANVNDLMRKLGVPKHKWPDEGLAPVMVDGIKVWVTPANPKMDKAAGVPKSSAHRVMCECPGCARIVPAGRLAQHKCGTKKRRGKVRRVEVQS